MVSAVFFGAKTLPVHRGAGVDHEVCVCLLVVLFCEWNSKCARDTYYLVLLTWWTDDPRNL